MYSGQPKPPHLESDDKSDQGQDGDGTKPKVNIGTPFYPKRAVSYGGGGLQSRWAPPQGQYRMEKENQYHPGHHYGGNGYRGGGGGYGRRPNYRHKNNYGPAPVPYYVDYQDWYAPHGPHMGGYYMDQPPPMSQKPAHVRTEKPHHKN